MATQNIYDLTDTWNNVATTFTAIKMNATDTASASGSLLMDLQVGGASKFKVDKLGVLTTVNVYSGGAVGYALYNDSGLSLRSVALVGWSSGNAFNASDTILGRNAAASLRLGAADAAAPVAQTFGAQGSRAGTDTNVGGANLTIRPGNGTGTGTISTLILQAPVAVASGTGAQTQTTGLTIRAGTAVMTSYTVATLPTAATAGAGARAFVTDALAPVFGSAVAGSGAVGVPVYSTGAAWNVG